MSNPNKTTRTVLRWTHLLVGFLIGVFVYTLAHDNEAFVLLIQAAVIPAVTLTGLGLGQQALDLLQRLDPGPMALVALLVAAPVAGLVVSKKVSGQGPAYGKQTSTEEESR